MNNVQLYLAIGIPTVMAILSIGTNVALYIHLNSTVTTRFASTDARLDMVLSKVVDVDNRLTRVEERMGIKG